jgi:hypothetical protein
VRGKGDPIAEIKIDEQSFVLTATHARESGIWPRVVAPSPKPDPDSNPPPPPTPPPRVEQDAILAEDVLKAALAEVFEKAGQRKVLALARLTVRVFDKGDALRMFPLVNSVPNAGRRVEFDAAYETKAGASVQINFQGPVDDGLPLRDLIDAQFRGAAETDGNFTFYLNFDPPLPVQPESLQRMTERLTRIVNPASQVIATPDKSR